MSKAETKLHEAIMRAINNSGHGRAVKHHGGRFGDAGHPDLYGVWDGCAFFVEVKTRGGGDPTALQYRQLELWAAAGAITGCARSVAQAIGVLDSGSGGQRIPASFWRRCRQLQGDS